jgi:hypothetical protein
MHVKQRNTALDQSLPRAPATFRLTQNTKHPMPSHRYAPSITDREPDISVIST